MLVDVFFPKNKDFFEIFEMYLPTTSQKSLIIAFLLTNLPKISRKRSKICKFRKNCLKIFRGAFGAAKTPLFPIFCPSPLVDGPPLRSNPPIPLITTIRSIFFCLPNFLDAMALVKIIISPRGMKIIYFLQMNQENKIFFLKAKLEGRKIIDVLLADFSETCDLLHLKNYNFTILQFYSSINKNLQ